MITSDTCYKLAEIVRDTWPQIYRPTVIEASNVKEGGCFPRRMQLKDASVKE
jgi:hypothetical protein